MKNFFGKIIKLTFRFLTGCWFLWVLNICSVHRYLIELDCWVISLNMFKKIGFFRYVVKCSIYLICFDSEADICGSVNYKIILHILQELQGWYILCGEALNQFSVLDSKCLKTQINQTQNLEKLTSEQTTSSTSTNPNHPGQLSKYFKNIILF